MDSNKFLNRDNAAPLGFGRALRTDYECFFAMQNLMLVGQALGHWRVDSRFRISSDIYQTDPSKGW